MSPEDSQWFVGQMERVLSNAATEFNASQGTLRDRFAMTALGGLLSFPHHEGFQFPPPSHSQPSEVASLAYAFADAMLVERERAPFAPMACCGRERDKDGGPNPNCECPAPLKPQR